MDSFKKLWLLLSPQQQKRGLLLLLFTFFGTLLEMVGLSLVVPLIGIMTSPDFIESSPIFIHISDMWFAQSQQSMIFAILAAMICIYLIKTLYLLTLTWIKAGYNLNIQVSVSKRLLNSYLHRPWLLHQKNNSSSYVQNVNTEAQLLMFHGFVGAQEIVTNLMLLVASVILLFLVEPIGTLIILTIMGFATWGFQYLSGVHLSNWGQTRKKHEALRLQWLQQSLHSVKEIKLWRCADYFIEKFHTHSLNLFYAWRWQTTLQQFPRNVLEFLAIIVLTITVFVMIYSGRSLDHIAPVIALFAAIFVKLMPAVNAIIRGLHSLRYIEDTIKSLYVELSQSHEYKRDQRTEGMQVEVDLVFNNVTFAYSEETYPAIKNINLKVPFGASIGIIGTSGAGKSTLIDLLLGLLVPDSGAIEVNGKNIMENLENWQGHIGYVPQSIYLIDDTLRRNIAFGLEDKDIDENIVMRAVEQAQLNVLLKNLPEGLDTIIGEDGGRLSGGEKQRIALARALYRNPSILVLDEATSSLDSKTESDVMQAVQQLKGKRTILIVTHRLSAIEDCDKVIKIEKGVIVSTE